MTETARDVIAKELEELEGPCESLALKEADAILTALRDAGYVVMETQYPPDYRDYLEACMTEHGWPDQTYEAWKYTASQR